jgi:hypothetical protein
MKDVNENRLSKFELALGFTKVFFLFFVFLWVSVALGHHQGFWLQRERQRVLGFPSGVAPRNTYFEYLPSYTPSSMEQEEKTVEQR